MKRILIIDDNVIICSIYRSTFVAEGFQVECAAEGEAGLNALDKFHPDIVLLDLSLPTINGLEVLSRIRANEATRLLPVVVLTNSFQPKMVEEARKFGANKCLRKSDCTPKVVVEAVLDLLENSRLRTTVNLTPGLSEERTPRRPQSIEELRKNFFTQAHAGIGDLRRLLQSVVKQGDQVQRMNHLAELRGTIPSLASSAAICGYREVAQVASALEVLAQQLRDRPQYLTPSTLRTMAQTIDFLGEYTGHLFSVQKDSAELPPNILVVDDDQTCREMVTFALAEVGLNCISLGSAKVALDVLESNRFDIVFLDVVMPEMEGYELCEKIRQQPHNAECPVVFVTGATEFEDRARSTLSGGTDLIAKPFLLVELAAKSLIHLYGRKIRRTPAVQNPKAA